MTTSRDQLVRDAAARGKYAPLYADVEGGEVIEVCRRGRPAARIVPLSSTLPPSADWSQAEERVLAAHPTPIGGVTATQTIVDGRGDR